MCRTGTSTWGIEAIQTAVGFLQCLGSRHRGIDLGKILLDLSNIEG